MKGYNLTGVIDWSNSQAAPIEPLAICPEFMVVPGLSDEENGKIIRFENLVPQSLKELETAKDKEQREGVTLLSSFMATKGAEITFRYVNSLPSRAVWTAKQVAKLTYGDNITWEKLTEVYGAMPIY